MEVDLSKELSTIPNPIMEKQVEVAEVRLCNDVSLFFFFFLSIYATDTNYATMIQWVK